MASEGNPIRFEIEQDIAHIILDNPPMNVLNVAMMDRISEVLERVNSDRSLKGVVFTASGKAFSAGADVGEHRPEKVGGMIESFCRMFGLLDGLTLPVVMAVDGPALGGGFELVLLADVLLASERATFGQPEIRLGFFAPVGVIELPALVGRARAMEITSLGRIYPAADMHAMGLVSQVVPTEQLDEVLAAVLKDLRRASPLVQRLNCRTLKSSRGLPFGDGLTRARQVFLEELMSSEDPVEGINSFYEKRKPDWKNR